MPPNLGGFFMVRSYYPSECHADYFDFERIEALKPAIEACGISTLSQSRSEERFSRNAETDLVCRLLLEKKKRSSALNATKTTGMPVVLRRAWRASSTMSGGPLVS